MSRPRDLPGLVERMRRLVRTDWDCPVVFSGYQGRGKSSLALQVFRRVDPRFSVDQVVFTQEDFMERCRSLGPGRAVLLDEALLHRRGSMTRERRGVVDFFQVNRELRQVTGLCFPHIGGLDKELAAKRVMFRFHIRARGYCEVKVPEISTEDAEPGGVYWRSLFAFRFGACPEPLWSRYRAAKVEFVRQRRQAEQEGEAVAEVGVGSVLDVDAAGPVLQEISRWEPVCPRGGRWSASQREAFAWWLER